MNELQNELQKLKLYTKHWPIETFNHILEIAIQIFEKLEFSMSDNKEFLNNFKEPSSRCLQMTTTIFYLKIVDSITAKVMNQPFQLKHLQFAPSKKRIIEIVGFLVDLYKESKNMTEFNSVVMELQNQNSELSKILEEINSSKAKNLELARQNSSALDELRRVTREINEKKLEIQSINQEYANFEEEKARINQEIEQASEVKKEKLKTLEKLEAMNAQYKLMTSDSNSPESSPEMKLESMAFQVETARRNYERVEAQLNELNAEVNATNFSLHSKPIIEQFERDISSNLDQIEERFNQLNKMNEDKMMHETAQLSWKKKLKEMKHASMHIIKSRCAAINECDDETGNEMDEEKRREVFQLAHELHRMMNDTFSGFALQVETEKLRQSQMTREFDQRKMENIAQIENFIQRIEEMIRNLVTQFQLFL